MSESDKLRLYDFGTADSGYNKETLQLIGWPINIWTCYIPENIDPEINILEKLILSLVQNQIIFHKEDIIDLLVKKLCINEELVDNIYMECEQKYFNKTYNNELKLNKNAEILIESINSEITPNMKMSDKLKKIYLCQDRVTNVVIPRFDIDTFDKENSKGYLKEVVIKIPKLSEGKEQPKTADINNALSQWAKFLACKQTGEINRTESIDINKKFSEEDKIVTLADKEEESFDLSTLTIIDDEPFSCLAKGYLVFNPAAPESINLISPFGVIYDDWFLKLLDRVLKTNDGLQEHVVKFVKDKKEELKDKIALCNELNIKLFDEFPFVCNNTKYADLKKAIEELYKNVELKRNGYDTSVNFVQSMRVAIETAFRTVVKEHPEILKMKNIYKNETDFYRYKTKINSIVDTYNLNLEIKKRYVNKNLFRNVINKHASNTKDNIAIILLYAEINPKSTVMQFIQKNSDLLIDVINLINIGNSANHAGEGYTQMVYSKEDIEKYYLKYENIVFALFNGLMKGE